MNATSANPYFRPNRCKCGHAYISHTGGVDTTITDCIECIPLGLNPNKHIFEAEMAMGPLPPAGSFFLVNGLKGYCNPGILGFSFQKILGLAATKGSPLVTLTNTTGIVPGMSFQTVTNTPGNTDTYTVIGVSGITITLDRPLDFNMLIGATIIFDGTFNSSTGPGRPSSNYQRGG